MGCGCNKGRLRQQKFLWFRDEATEPIVYDSVIQARAKVLRSQGQYIPYDPTQPMGPQIAARSGG